MAAPIAVFSCDLRLHDDRARSSATDLSRRASCHANLGRRQARRVPRERRSRAASAGTGVHPFQPPIMPLLSTRC
jgi:hypothetical protein